MSMLGVHQKEVQEDVLQIKKKDICLKSYAEHWGDKNCKWVGTHCTEGQKCDDARDLDEARRLGLLYYNGAWRRKGVPVSFTSDYNHNMNRGGSSKANAKEFKKNVEKALKASGPCINSCNGKKSCVLHCLHHVNQNKRDNASGKYDNLKRGKKHFSSSQIKKKLLLLLLKFLKK